MQQIELKDDDDAIDTFNLARMDADNDRASECWRTMTEIEESGFAIADAEEADQRRRTDSECRRRSAGHLICTMQFSRNDLTTI